MVEREGVRHHALDREDGLMGGDVDLAQLEGYDLLGRFRLGKLLGQGGYGAVFEAEQLSVGRRCAVKILQAQQIGAADNVVGRFRAEAVVTSRLAHPNTVVIYDFGHDTERDLLFLAMEYLEGRSLHEELAERGPMALDVALHVVDQIAASLQDAHEQGVVHRDLKPHNVMLIKRGTDDYFVKVIDFGIAKMLAGEVPMEASKQLTMTGVMIGTPHYMAPEQIRGQDVDGRADVYALGHCIYKLLTGRTCFQGGAPMDIAIRQLSDRPLPLRALHAELDVSSSFERVVLRALEKDREQRWPTMLEFAQALREAARAHRRPAPEPPAVQQRAEERTRRMATIPPTEPLTAPTTPRGQETEYRTEHATTQGDLLGPTGPMDAPEASQPATRPMTTPAPALVEAPVRVMEVGGVRDGGTLAMPTPVDQDAPAAADAAQTAAPGEPAPKPRPTLRKLHPTPTDAISAIQPIPARERSAEPEATAAASAPTGAGGAVRAPLIAALGVGLLLCVAAIIALITRDTPAPATPADAPAVAAASAPTVSAPPAQAVEPAPDLGAQLAAPPDMAAAQDLAAAPDIPLPAEPAPEDTPTKKPEEVAAKHPPKEAPKAAGVSLQVVSLQVVIVPYGELYMDGKRLTKGTRMTVSVPVGKHTFEARDKGMRSKPVTVEIKPDHGDVLRLSLREETPVGDQRKPPVEDKPSEKPAEKPKEKFDPNKWSVP